MLKQQPSFELDRQLDLSIEPLRLHDLPEIARLNEEAFAGHFLGHMGLNFLKLFCAQFINSPTNYGFVAKSNGRPVGFLFGTIDSEPFYQFYHQNLLELSLIVIKKYITDAYVRKHLTQRLGYILVAFKTLFTSPKSESNLKQDNTLVPARLLALGVDLNYRGTGLAHHLTSRFCAQMKQEGFKKVGLSALTWNKRALRFYKKDGWIQESRSETSVSFLRSI